MAPTDTVITGLGVVSSIGIGHEAFAESLKSGRSGIRDLTQLPSDSFADIWVGDSLKQSHGLKRAPFLGIGGPIVDFDAKQFVKPRKALKVMCREIQTTFASARLAIEDAGLDSTLPIASSDTTANVSPSLSIDRIGTVFGSEMLYGQPVELADAFEQCCDDSGRVDKSQFGNAAMTQIMPLWMLKYLPNMPACHVGISLGVRGPNNTLTLGDVSGGAALYEAMGYLKRGIADAMITAACGSRMNVTRSVFTEDQPLSPGHEPVDRSSRPHARDADGLVRGEASASLVVETRRAAEMAGHAIWAKVTGLASRFVASESFRSGRRTNRMDANAGRGSQSAMTAAMTAAMKQANVGAEQIGLLVSHAMGDPAIDSLERQAIASCLPDVPVAMPISLTGHTGAASGMLEIATGLLCLRHRMIPPVPHAHHCVSGLNVCCEPRQLKQNAVLVLTHTSPGSATATVLETDET
ncbi:MAG: beta-ketoacyl synthase N-terminal-like domain-containing protein [Planctomycetota bacterium]